MSGVNCPSCGDLKEEIKDLKATLDHVESAKRKLHDICDDQAARIKGLKNDIRVMVEKAADEKLDGYRELGERAANAENLAERYRGTLRIYGNPDNWVFYDGWHPAVEIMPEFDPERDPGELARKSLEGK